VQQGQKTLPEGKARQTKPSRASGGTRSESSPSPRLHPMVKARRRSRSRPRTSELGRILQPRDKLRVPKERAPVLTFRLTQICYRKLRPV